MAFVMFASRDFTNIIADFRRVVLNEVNIKSGFWSTSLCPADPTVMHLKRLQANYERHIALNVYDITRPDTFPRDLYKEQIITPGVGSVKSQPDPETHNLQLSTVPQIARLWHQQQE
jgi:hypothetical protein